MRPTRSKRMIVTWRSNRDGELLADLSRFTARGRGARLRYLARLGALSEKCGFHLEGLDYQGALVFPVSTRTVAVGGGMSGEDPMLHQAPDPLRRMVANLREEDDKDEDDEAA